MATTTRPGTPRSASGTYANKQASAIIYMTIPEMRRAREIIQKKIDGGVSDFTRVKLEKMIAKYVAGERQINRYFERTHNRCPGITNCKNCQKRVLL